MHKTEGGFVKLNHSDTEKWCIFSHICGSEINQRACKLCLLCIENYEEWEESVKDGIENVKALCLN